jgi:predicted Zn-dependent protease
LPAYRLHFRAGPKALGPNAFALPGGDIVLTDALVELAADEPDIITGVLAHELGHVRHRHGMRLALQAGMVAGVSGLLVGDFSALLAGLPAWLAQADYSREFEREADLHARQMLQAAGISPRVMVRFFERLTAYQQQRGQDKSPLPMAFASHPAHAERIAFFNAAP